MIPHGVRLSLGGADPVEAHLAACAAALDAPLVSEHVAFVRAGGHDAGLRAELGTVARSAGFERGAW